MLRWSSSTIPPCVFTSYEFIYGTSVPDPGKTLLGQGTDLFRGVSFLECIGRGKLKAMGCTGVYYRDYLKRIRWC